MGVPKKLSRVVVLVLVEDDDDNEYESDCVFEMGVNPQVVVVTDTRARNRITK